jgi:hypothetical protein
MLKKIGGAAAALALTFALSPAAQASFFSDTLVAGTTNTYEDNSREAVIDVNGNGTFDAGDVIVGFIRMDLQSAPVTNNFDNNVYVIISQQLLAPTASCPAPFQCFAPTTTSGLTLADLGVTGADANGMFALYSGSTTDLISTPPSPTATMQDYLNTITSDLTLDLVAGFQDPEDFLTATAFIHVTFDDASIGTTCTTGLLCLETQTIAAVQGGLSILQNNTGFTFADSLPSTNPAGGSPLDLFQIAITGGNATGASDDQHFNNFGDATGLGGSNWTQCHTTAAPDVNLPCGVRDNADFSVVPTTTVAEPAPLALLGISLLALVGFGRRRN